MSRSTSLGFIDGARADQRIELLLAQGISGQLQFTMSEQHYADGIGWFTQRSMSLDPAQVSQLKRMLQLHPGSTTETKKPSSTTPATLKLHHIPPAEDSTLADVG